MVHGKDGWPIREVTTGIGQYTHTDRGLRRVECHLRGHISEDSQGWIQDLGKGVGIRFTEMQHVYIYACALEKSIPLNLALGCLIRNACSSLSNGQS